MRTPRIYLETTIFNYYFDRARDSHADTVKLFEEIRAGKYEPYTSSYVLDELEETKDDGKRREMLALIGEYGITVIPGDDESRRFANIHVRAGIIPAMKSYDSLHIAVATVNDMDYVFSFNFQHINRIKTKTMTSAINLGEGYKPVTIATPGEVVEHGDNE
uniref:PIN domain-containing protein n=1 Tax=uncultured bacterium contig00006 TaxID=1181498 RepID=A0A806KBQ6_9BACT|nr:hypothetical protein [uncultured bacterium contig00006]